MKHWLLPLARLRVVENEALASLPPGTLMSRAAQVLADRVGLLAGQRPRGLPIDVLVGNGNNGADALLAGMILKERGYRVRCHLPGSPSPNGSEALLIHQRWRDGGGSFEAQDTFPEVLTAEKSAAPLIIDGLFGIGLNRAISGTAAAWIAQANRSSACVVAVDIPSGLDADRGQPVGAADAPVLRADHTITFIADKPGLRTGLGPECAGRVVVEPLGLTDACDRSAQADQASSAQTFGAGMLFGQHQANATKQPRPANSHKGTFGSVAVLGGAQGTRGAVYLAALGAQSGGAGKVFIACPDADSFDPGYPQFMSRPFETDWSDVQAIAIGCGLGDSAVASQCLRTVLSGAVPAVIDADGLNMLARQPELRALLVARKAPTVLTPHPLEAARLLGLQTAEIQQHRIARARELSASTGAIVVLKGAGTIVCGPDGSWSVNASGSSALATGGTGDVLAGVIASLLAQGYPASDAARLGVWLHGRAGDLWHRDHPQGAGLAAVHLARLLPCAWTDGINL